MSNAAELTPRAENHDDEDVGLYDRAKYYTANYAATKLRMARSPEKLIPFLEKSYKVSPAASYRRGARFHALYLKEDIDSVFLRMYPPPPPPNPAPAAEKTAEPFASSSPELVSLLNNILARMNQLSTKADVDAAVSPLVDLVAELDGRVTKLTAECAALVAYLNNQK